MSSTHVLSQQVDFTSTATGALRRTVQDKLIDTISVKDFGAVGDGVADDTAAIQLALTYANSISGCVVFAPRGIYKCTSALNIYKKTILIGEGAGVTTFTFNHIGDGIKSTWAINSSTAANISVRDMSIVCTNASNTGGGFADVGGSYIHISNTNIAGFNYQIIFDQTEVSSIVQCNLTSGTNQSGVWLVNGADHTVGANANYTNRITIDQNQFNSSFGLYSIIDDGGVAHSITNNNFNGGGCGARMAGVISSTITGNYSEVMVTYGDLYLTDTKLSAAYIGPCSGLSISGNIFNSSGAGYTIGIINANNSTITGNYFGQAIAGINFLNGTSNKASGIVIEGNAKSPAMIFVSGGSRSFRQNVIRQTCDTASIGAAAAGAATITPMSMEFIGVGTRLTLGNSNGTNYEDVIVTAITASTFTAILATTKAANFVINGGTQAYEQEGSFVPVLLGAGTAGINTYSINSGHYIRRGNQVTVDIYINVTAKDAAMAGALSVSGLPFVSENISNVFPVAAVIFSGFTFPANYTGMVGQILPSTSALNLYRQGSSVAATSLQATDIAGATCVLGMTFSYATSSLYFCM